MDKLKLNAAVELYMNNNTNELALDFELHQGAKERFILHSAKRLKNSYDLFKLNLCGLNDVLISLRDYLLTLQVQIQIDTLDIPKENEFGLVKDLQTGKYFASYQFPKYVNHSFAEKAFLSEEFSTQEDSRGHNLHTDPLIVKITGFHQFKSIAQKLAVYGALNTPNGYTTLVSLPTGGGKSLITQTLAYQKEGLTIVIVPTVSLAIDQVRVAKGIIKSSRIDDEVFSYNSGVDPKPILKAIRNKTAKMLFISPEALINNTEFVDVIKEANSTRYLKNIVIDEAHIVIDWGASFRIDYQCLESWRKKLLLSNPNIRTILLSATFEHRCISILKDFFSSDGKKWIEIRCDSLRHEPRYMLVKSKSYSDKKRKMLDLVRKMPHPMIIYVARPDDAGEIAEYLHENDIKNVKTFTGLTTGIRRKELIDAWVDDQFDIMVATSAFGVGVDKSDVRSVLHTYIPQNPNAYYQELGRGGRDRLPCLSIMCIYPDDLSIAFGRISKKVMTTEKIVGRWNSMYNSDCSPRKGKLNYIDTSIRPIYSSIDVFDDTPTSDADMNWNIYVLLFLRRFGLIKIHEVIPQSTKYIFVIEISEDALRMNDDHQTEVIDSFRSIEWKYYQESFQTMQTAIKRSESSCWSEMFYETYDKVSEYCAGCNSHNDPNESDFVDFPLKIPVDYPFMELAQDQMAFFSSTREIIIIPSEKERSVLLNELSRLRISAFISSNDNNLDVWMNGLETNSNFIVLNAKDLRELVKKKSYYFLSGLIAVKYSGSTKDIYDLLKFVQSNLSTHSEIKVVHIIDENIYFDWINKAFVDLVNGPVIPVRAII